MYPTSVTPGKTNMTIENPTINEDASHISKFDDFPSMPMLVFKKKSGGRLTDGEKDVVNKFYLCCLKTS